MSVPKSERKPSNVEYIVKLQMIEQFFISMNNDENNRINGLNDRLVELSMNAYDYATTYFEMCNGRIEGTLAQKKKYCQLTFWEARKIASQINILIAFRLEQGKSTKGLVIKTKELLDVCNQLRGQLTLLNKQIS